MEKEERIAMLERENQKLRQDNEILMNTVIQMRETINRLLGRYISRNENG